ncbi:MAG: DUF6371 domain-containing protein [Prevotella sp.]|nr:DUF6371 domain-containing protein [Prevotella sp.]
MTMEEVFKHTFKAMRKRLDEQRAEGRRLWQQRLGTASEFCRAVVSNGFLSEEQMQRAAQRYRLGASRDGGVIFWQIDECDQLRDGKIMHYRPDCHRDHDRKPTWAAYLLRKAGQLPQDWNTDHCLFGLHLLETHGQGGGSPIAVVEAEKTAVIMSEVKPEYVWLATGGKTELNVAKLRPLEGRRIILFPDTDADGQTYRDWYDVAEAASDVFGHPVTVSSLLEQRATPAQKAAKIDLVDLLFPKP